MAPPLCAPSNTFFACVHVYKKYSKPFYVLRSFVRITGRMMSYFFPYVILFVQNADLNRLIGLCLMGVDVLS